MISAAYPVADAAAEPSAADKSLATALFKEGRTLVDQGHVAEGCRKLEESQRLDPGGGTLLNVALCHEKEGRTATAWAEFTEALGIAKKDDRSQRIDFAQKHIAQLEPSLSRLIVQVPHAGETPDLEVKRDGSAIGRPAWGLAMPVDPGDHLIEAAAAGKITWKQSVTVGPKGDSKTIMVPALENAPAPVSAAPLAAGGSVGSPGPASGFGVGSDSMGADSAMTTGSHGPSAASWVALGVGVAALGTGTYFGLRAISKKNDADRNCPNDQCVGEGSKENSDAIKFANIATAGFAVGVVGLGLGIYLWATSSSSPRASVGTPHVVPKVSVSSVGVSARPSGTELTIAGSFP
jgi:hypothetical protein